MNAFGYLRDGIHVESGDPISRLRPLAEFGTVFAARGRKATDRFRKNVDRRGFFLRSAHYIVRERMWNKGTVMTALGLGYDSRAVANRILQMAAQKGRPLTIMQLVKLVYFAQAWYLAFTDKPITFHKAQAWQYGPVYPLVYKAFPGAGSKQLDGMIVDKLTGRPYEAAFTEDEQALLDWILDQYGKLHAFDLSKRTHIEDGPWAKAIERGGTYSEISDADLRSHFKQFVKDDAQ